ncbi:hypothetical protein EJ08DRAFT_422545 [Tothia fuscella]|uniref:Bud emergence protein 1 n=1 Tax=Tothia fuscella TaxID=1048955 RepID=A0A9P4NJ85_9PEZI|nr:hypothetical protein EJ08DRAFT_422545 [Tothia fuscella]
MVKFRMSMKSNSDRDTKPAHVSIPAKDAIAIVPPKKVIKALYDYQAPDTSPNSGYLSFTQGDFLHVVGRENDNDWYEACNPLQGTRGLVPVKYFDIVGKQARNSAGSSGSGGAYQAVGAVAPHDSGYADNTTMNGANGPQRLSKTMSKGMIPGQGTGAMVYGVVVYDFKAERPDELEAKEGEAIIVIAQSNPEWFVAKPITRLGGPGLIPVSFIEIRDMTTGQAVADPHEAIKKAGVPKVEEWKKLAADYKNGSIPLGQLAGSGAGQQGLQQGMARMSLGNQSQGSYDSGASTIYGQQNAAAYNNQQAYPNSNLRPQAPQLLAPVKASVPRYCFADEIFWFIVECQMEDGRHWELSRLYQDFYDLQINLIQEHPLEAGNVKGVERSLPYMPGPVTYVTDNISNGRRANLDEYIRNLLRLGQHITRGGLVRAFFAPREGDYEIDPNQPVDYRLSTGSQDSPANPSATASPQSSAGNLSQGQQSGIYNQQVQQRPGQAGHYRTGSQATTTSPPPLGNRSNTNASSATVTAMKIKVWFESDSCVVIRMPPQFKYDDLYKKLKERRALERIESDGKDPDQVMLEIMYRDEAESRLCPIQSDQDLKVALERNERLTLNVRAR